MAEIKAGDVFVCADEDGCGIEVEVKKVCGCIDECDLVCCGKQMNRKEASCCGGEEKPCCE